jgi:hypothetical protein
VCVRVRVDVGESVNVFVRVGDRVNVTVCVIVSVIEGVKLTECDPEKV